MLKNILRNTARVLVTLLVVAVAIYAGRHVWLYYTGKPWTRDGRIRAIVLNIAPDVSGVITHMPLKDNQRVRKGDLLFTIDSERYKLALDQARLEITAAATAIISAQAGVKTAEANLKTAQANLRTAQDNLGYQRRELDRRRTLIGSGAGTQEDLERAENIVIAAQYSVTSTENAVTAAENALTTAKNTVVVTENRRNQALSAAATAELNVTRAEVRSPVNGYVTNLQIDAGDYAMAGKPMLAIVNSDSLYAAGYFEETKIRHIRENAPATIHLMGYKQPVRGHVESIAPAIADRDNTQGSDLVANVNPTFSWVRLAQRIPVRIAIDEVPDGVRLTAGMTATIIIEDFEEPGKTPPQTKAK